MRFTLKSWLAAAVLAPLALTDRTFAKESALGAATPAAKCDCDEWQADVEAFAKQDAQRPFAPGGIVFVGSSSIRLWDLAKWFPDLPVLNRGFGGSQICHSVQLVQPFVLKHRPRLIVFYAGDNDVAGGKGAEQVHADFRAFVAAVRKELPRTPIAYIAIKPSLARWEQRPVQQQANELIAKDCAADPLLEFFDVVPPMLGADGRPRKELFVDDGLHMNDAGYQIWVDLVRPLLEEEKPR